MNIFTRDNLVKLLVLIPAMLISAIGINFFLYTGFGADSVGLLIDGLARFFSLNYGVMSVIYNAAAIAVALIIARNHIYIGTFVAGVMFGVFISLTDPFISTLFATGLTMVQRLAYLGVGLVMLFLGLGLIVALRFGLSPMDAIIFFICERTKWQYRYVKIAFDIALALIGWLLGGTLGIGTAICFFTAGPAIQKLLPIYNNTILKKLNIQSELNNI